MMAISNIDANVRSTNNSNMNTKKIKRNKILVQAFPDNRINFMPDSIIELKS